MAVMEEEGVGGGLGHKSANSCRMGQAQSVIIVVLVCVGRLLMMGCDPFLMSVCRSVGGGETLWEQNGLPWGHSAGNQ